MPEMTSYDIWNYVSTLMMFFYIILQVKKFKDISTFSLKQKTVKKQYLISVLEILALVAVSFGLFLVLNPAFGDWFTEGNANYFGSLTAWFLTITVLSIVFQNNPMKVHDLLAPALPLQLVFAKIACFTTGCCSSFELEGSFYYNPANHRYEFPIQLVETIVAIALFIALIIYQNKNTISGSMFPLYLVLYSITRFITEFLRADLPNVLGPFDAYQILSFVGIIIGVLLFIMVVIFKKKNISFFDIKVEESTSKQQ